MARMRYSVQLRASLPWPSSSSHQVRSPSLVSHPHRTLNPSTLGWEDHSCAVAPHDSDHVVVRLVCKWALPHPTLSTVLLPSPGQRKSTSGALCPLPLALPVTQGVQMFNLDVPRGGLARLQSSMVARDLVASHCLPSQHQHHPSPLAPSRAMPHPLATQPTFTGPKSALLRPWRALEVHLDLQALPGPFLGLKSSNQLSAPALLDPRTPPSKGEAPRPPG